MAVAQFNHSPLYRVILDCCIRNTDLGSIGYRLIDQRIIQCDTINCKKMIDIIQLTKPKTHTQ